MKKVIFFFLLLIPLNILAIDYPKLNSKYAIVYNLSDDEMLYEMDSDKVISIASLTKIATTITAIEEIKDLNEKVTITQKILNTVDPVLSKAGLKAGDEVTYQDLLYASMLPSGADATNSLAILSSGSIDSFVSKMNDLAKRIGLKDTHFVNVTGLDEEGHYSSTKDVLNLLKYALNNKTFREVFTTKKYTLSNGLVVKSTLDKYNASLNLDLSKVLGSKTGFTYDAGYCMASLSKIDNHEIIIINLDAPYESGISYHLIDNANLIDFVEDNYDNITLVAKNDVIKKINVSLSNISTYSIRANDDIIKLLPIDYDKNLLEIKYEGKEKLNFIDKKGNKIGTITYKYNGKEILTEDEIIDTDIKINIVKIIKSYFYIPLIIIILPLILKKKHR
ncbi:MAG: D-alanyl-D-alanine carboxypeptidase [Bacilli bacterium]|nr:D-alanyl-D-alanine carboxypeptidase [Bacilli bacterium]